MKTPMRVLPGISTIGRVQRAYPQRGHGKVHEIRGHKDKFEVISG